MANWQRHLNLEDIWSKGLNKEISVQGLALEISLRLKNLKPFSDENIEEEKLDIVDEFDSLSLDEEATVEDFDYIMSRLYDWADTPLDNQFGGKKVCWVKTIF